MFPVQTWLRAARSRRIETAILLSFLVLIAVVGGSAWYSAGKLSEFIDASQRNRYYAQVAFELESVFGDMHHAESQQRGYLLTDDPSHLSAYDAALVQVREGLARLVTLMRADPEGKAEMDELKALLDRRLELLGSGIHFQRTGHPDKAREVVAEGRPVSRALRERYSALRPQYQAALSSARLQVAQMREDAIHSFIVTSGLAAVVLAIMAALVILEARFVRALSRRLLHQSRHDELTGLPNRAYLNESLARGISGARRAGEKLGLLYLDLNGFKQVNDALGHGAGDGVLIEVARRLERIARESDFVARLGGDEFAVVTPRIADATQMEAAAARYAELSVVRDRFVVGASVGYAIYPDDADTADALLKAGDGAMYERKAALKRR